MIEEKTSYLSFYLFTKIGVRHGRRRFEFKLWRLTIFGNDLFLNNVLVSLWFLECIYFRGLTSYPQNYSSLLVLAEFIFSEIVSNEKCFLRIYVIQQCVQCLHPFFVLPFAGFWPSKLVSFKITLNSHFWIESFE